MRYFTFRSARLPNVGLQLQRAQHLMKEKLLKKSMVSRRQLQAFVGMPRFIDTRLQSTEHLSVQHTEVFAHDGHRERWLVAEFWQYSREVVPMHAPPIPE